MKQGGGPIGSVCYGVMVMFLPWWVSAQTTTPPANPSKATAPAPAQKSTTAAKPAPCCAPATQKPQASSAQKSAPPQKMMARKGPPRGPIEKFDCKIGTEDNHARIAVLAQGGEVQSVAYYSKWTPRTCSVHLQRGDAYSRWKDTGDATTINTEFGDFLIQSSRSEYQFFFREVDRMHYCGMMGKLNGSMTVTRGPKRTCKVEGIMDRNESEKEVVAQPPEQPVPDKPPAVEVK